MSTASVLRTASLAMLDNFDDAFAATGTVRGLKPLETFDTVDGVLTGIATTDPVFWRSATTVTLPLGHLVDGLRSPDDTDLGMPTAVLAILLKWPDE